jgi:hypothetical protein
VRSVAQGGTTLDLSVLAATAYTWRKTVRWTVLVLAILFSTLIISILVFNLARGTFGVNLDATYGAAYIGLIAGTIMCGWAFWLFGPGATQVSITANGLTFRYASGREDRLDWSDPRFKLDLWDWTRGAGFLPPDALYEASMSNRPRTQLTPTAFQTILQSANNQGLKVISKTAGAARYGSPGQVLLLRAKSS